MMTPNADYALDFMHRVGIRDAALDRLVGMVDQPDLSEYEVPISRLASDWQPAHVHGKWEAGRTPSGHIRWSCGGCGYSPPVMVPLPVVGKDILAEWWDGYRVDLSPLDERPRI